MEQDLVHGRHGKLHTLTGPSRHHVQDDVQEGAQHQGIRCTDQGDHGGVDGSLRCTHRPTLHMHLSTSPAHIQCQGCGCAL